MCKKMLKSFTIFSYTAEVHKHHADIGFNRCASLALTGITYSFALLYVSMDFVTSSFHSLVQ